MSEIDFGGLKDQMLAAAKEAAGDTWTDVCGYVEEELAILATNLTTLYQLKVEGIITEEQAKKHFEIKRNAAEAGKHTLKGQADIGAANAINAALAAIRDFIAEKFGWVIFF